MDKNVYWIWLRKALEGNTKLMYALYQTLGEAEKIFRLDRSEYEDIGIPQNYLSALADKDLTAAYNIFGQCCRFGISVLSIEDAAYPEALRQIALPPCVLFYQGDFEACFERPTITLIGTRYSTASGEVLAAEFARGLSLSGFTLLCGVAKGIEATVQNAVVQADGRCALILPCGHLSVGTRVKNMMRDVLPRGVVISELLPHEKTPFGGYHMRNRLLSALSEGTLVLQAPIKSGTQITAGYALEQGKDVFVLPGSLRDPSYAGNNQLLRDGAMPIIDFTDIVEYYRSRFDAWLQDVIIEDESFEGFVRSISQCKEFDSEEQQQIFSVITETGITVDEIVLLSGIPAHKVLSQLTIMEMKGWVAPMPGGKYKMIV